MCQCVLDILTIANHEATRPHRFVLALHTAHSLDTKDTRLRNKRRRPSLEIQRCKSSDSVKSKRILVDRITSNQTLPVIRLFQSERGKAITGHSLDSEFLHTGEEAIVPITNDEDLRVGRNRAQCFRRLSAKRLQFLRP